MSQGSTTTTLDDDGIRKDSTKVTTGPVIIPKNEKTETTKPHHAKDQKNIGAQSPTPREEDHLQPKTPDVSGPRRMSARASKRVYEPYMRRVFEETRVSKRMYEPYMRRVFTGV